MLTVARSPLFCLLLTLIRPPVLMPAQSAPEALGPQVVNPASTSTSSKASFEVTTIKPSDTYAPHGTGIRTVGSHVAAFNFSVGDLIGFSYGLQAKQIAARVSPLLETHFDIDGVPIAESHPNQVQLRLMFQQLLISRFRLAFHYESRELPAYAIQIAKGGPRLAVTTRKPSDSTGFSYNRQAVLTIRNASFGDIAKGMQDAFMDRPVVDQTGLPSRYDFDLRWTPDEAQSYCPVAQGRAGDDPNATPGLYTAIQEQVGLKLVPVKASVQVMVIDHIEQPSEN